MQASERPKVPDKLVEEGCNELPFPQIVVQSRAESEEYLNNSQSNGKAEERQWSLHRIKDQK